MAMTSVKFTPHLSLRNWMPVTSRYRGGKISESQQLERYGNLHCRTMEDKYGLTFSSWVQSCTGKSWKHVNLFVISAIFAGPRFNETFATMVTWGINLSSLSHINQATVVVNHPHSVQNKLCSIEDLIYLSFAFKRNGQFRMRRFIF